MTTSQLYQKLVRLRREQIRLKKNICNSVDYGKYDGRLEIISLVLKELRRGEAKR